MPGQAYTGDDPDGFMTRDQLVGFFDRYAQSFAAPVHTGVTVQRVRPGDQGWIVETSAERFAAANVVVATGYHDLPRIPQPCSRVTPASVAQYHTSDYRHAAQLPRGGVTDAPGLYFLGLRWMHRRGSDTIHGVGADAAHLAGIITRRPVLSAQS